MTQQEKNVEIAKMLGWEYDEISESFDTPFLELVELQAFGDEQFSSRLRDFELKFHSDANWQFEAIKWIENLKIGKNGYAYMQIVKNNIWIYVYKNHTNYIGAFFSGVEHPKATKKEAIFEALFQFSQYLKEKK